MVSALAVQLNQHLWNHTSSCFKQSRATEHKSYCRYRFPGGRVDKTTFETSGVELSRTLGHEFINGFNYEIMATFRCNHDIQQKQLDLEVAVTVAALQRRQDREKAEMEVLGTQDRLALPH
ncbi:hypothetical protein GQ600_23751 [Phytophthora cactorum]|nr:hypothetical protein GQ600_23751 [Phytophthora cactorum]